MYSEIFIKFCKERNIKKSTQTGYESALSKYTNLHKMPLEDLLDEAICEENNLVPLKKRKIKKRLLDFRSYLFSTDLSPNSVRTYFTKVLTFYMHFEVEIPNIPQAKYDKLYEISYNDLPTKRHIREAVEASSADMKAIILFMASSGSAKAETLSLTVGDFVMATREYHNGGDLPSILNRLEGLDGIIPTFYLKRIKTGKYYYTFCSPEATRYIIRYLKSRFDLSFEDKLFDISDSKLLNNFQQINDDLKWGFKGKYRFFRSHTLRKFHASNIGIAAEYIDSLQGRGKNIIHETYIKTNPEKLKELYKSVVGNVEIFSSPEDNTVTQEFNIVINVFLAGKEYNII
ncbi:MAG: site-specific integrase [Methanobrevibacter sp.]|nr:site-specific integrase [Methanobrevibacter sp.]